MLSIAPVTANRVGYYVSHVGGRDDLQGPGAYYADADPGVSAWRGRGAAAAGLAGPVGRDQLERLLAGTDPTSGDQLVRRALKTPAYDLCFSAPKSVSLLWGTADPSVVAAVSAAHDAAVDAALTWLEDEVVVVRRGKGGIDRLPADGLRSATFRHLASRAGDPQLHTHCVTSALVTGDDDVVSAFDSAALYRASKLAGAVYQQTLRHELATALGVAWGPTRNAMADVAGIPDEVLEVFSQRSAAIAEQLDELGSAGSAKARQAAALSTRQAKDEAPEHELRAEWTDRLTDTGWSADRLLAPGRATKATARSAEVIGELLAGPDGVTANVAHYGRREALLGWFDHAPAAWTAAEVIDACDTWLTDQIGIRQASAAPDGWTKARYTCEEILAAEQRILATSTARLTEITTGLCSAAAAAAAVEIHTLTAEQQALLEEVCLSGRGLTVAVGVAGAGKSHALRAVTDVAHAAGYDVIATSTAAKAALDLAEAAGMDHAASLARLLGDLDRGSTQRTDPSGRRRWQPFTLDKATMIVLDEGAMAESRHVDRLTTAAAAAGAKIVIVGDPHQLQAVGAGGSLLDLADLGGVVELTSTVRAEADWERYAQVAWRNGDPTTLARYQAEERITTLDDSDAGRAGVLAAWAADLDADADTVMLAYRRADVAALNDAARAHRIASGDLAAKFEVQANECDDAGQVVRSFALCADDRVIVTRNSPAALNGEQGTVRIAHTDGSVTVALPSNRSAGGCRLVHLDAEALATGGVALAYALTGHKAQGVTVDRCHVLADGAMTKQWGYSALTRGRHTNTLTFVTDPDREATADEQLAEAWMRDDLEHTAQSLLAVAPESEPDLGLGLGRERDLALAR